jgi:hypothetical protein
VSDTSGRRTIVSAADHQYCRTLCQFLLSVERCGAPSSCDVLVVDLGLTDGDRARLRARFPWCRVEPFDFGAQPPHVRRLATCAWKPIAIAELLSRRGGLALWLDSGTVLHAPVAPVFDRIARDGLLTLVGQSPIRRWCHAETLRAMDVPAEDAGKRCRSGGVLGFDGGNRVVCDLVEQWRHFSLMPECIDPPGASRANHRYDQAILSNLLYAFARRHALELSDDEIDISSVAPARWLSTRNTVATWVPLALDPVVRAVYDVHKRLDRAALIVKRSFGVRF